MNVFMINQMLFQRKKASNAFSNSSVKLYNINAQMELNAVNVKVESICENNYNRLGRVEIVVTDLWCKDLDIVQNNYIY